jgi:hypothetical protein
MLAAIQLYNDPMLWAAEVDYERTNWMLPAKSHAIESAVSQASPKLALSIRLIPTQLSSSVSKDTAVRHPLTLALSPMGRGNLLSLTNLATTP